MRFVHIQHLHATSQDIVDSTLNFDYPFLIWVARYFTVDESGRFYSRTHYLRIPHRPQSPSRPVDRQRRRCHSVMTGDRSRFLDAAWTLAILAIATVDY